MMPLLRRGAAGVLLLAALALVFRGSVSAHDLPRETSGIEQRIAFYTPRLGGPATYPAYARLGLALLDKAALTGSLQLQAEGMRHLETSLAYQANAEALLGLARGNADRHWFPAALQFAEQARLADSESAAILSLLFDIRLAMGRDAEAAVALEAYRRGRPFFGAYAREAAWQESQGCIPEALAALRQCTNAPPGMVSSPPLRAWVLVRMGSLELMAGDIAAAGACFREALVVQPGDRRARERLAQWHAALGRWTEACVLFGALVEERPAAGARRGLAEAWLHLGAAENAAAEEGRALEELRHAAALGEVAELRPLVLLLTESERPAAREEALLWARRDAELRQDAGTLDALAWACWRAGLTNEAVQLGTRLGGRGHAVPAIQLHQGLIECGAGRPDFGRVRLRAALDQFACFGPHERRLAAEAAAWLDRTRVWSPVFRPPFP